MRYDTISFLSDYGRKDEFVGVVHSVIRSIAPDVRVIDITHDIDPYDVRAGGLTLVRSANYLAPGVVIAVVDPTVGTQRRAIAVEIGGGSSVLVGPDNGLLAPLVSMYGHDRIVEITNPDYLLQTDAATFDGRDVFAPAAAHLCNGVDISDLGPAVDPYSLFPGLVPLPREENGALLADVLWIDHYGNVQLNVTSEDLLPMGDTFRLTMANGTVRSARFVEDFASLGDNDLGLLVDSYGLVAVVRFRNSAAADLQVSTADAVTIEPLEESSGVTTPVTLTQRKKEN